MGHVPPRTLPAPGQGDELPRRQHRGARALPASLDDPAALARFGESLAADFLRRRGWTITERNLRVGRREIDLVATRGPQRMAVEVRTRRAPGDGVDSLTAEKVQRVRIAARRVGIGRIGLMAVTLRADHVDLRFVDR